MVQSARPSVWKGPELVGERCVSVIVLTTLTSILAHLHPWCTTFLS